MPLIRAFIAVDLPDAVRLECEALQKRLAAQGLDLKWVLPASMHLTLKFLGEISTETFDDVLHVLAEPFDVGGPIRLSLAGAGAFPSSRRARIVWAGLAGDISSLARAALSLDTRTAGVGVPRETKPFSPHLTLGRSRGPSGVGDVSALLKKEKLSGPAFEVTSFRVYESVLGPGGPIHTPRKTIPLP